MTTNLLPINTLTIRATSISDTNRRKATPSSAGNKWWTPLFGFSNNADYIETNNNNNNNKDDEVENIPAKTTKYTPGGFTEEKAKMLRMRTKESFHDVMYHSAIASRLASDFSKRDAQ